MIAVVLALAPSALLVLWLRRLGMLPEGGRVAKALLAGAAAVACSVAVGEVASVTLARVVPAGTAPHHVLRYVICIALVEEASKRRAVIRATRGGGAFALAVLVGIGFGAVEDALYVATGTGWLPRALTCASGHPLYGAVMGALLDMSLEARGRGDAKSANLYGALSLLAPTSAHGLFDVLAMADGPLRVPCVLCALAMAGVGSAAFVRMVGRRAPGRAETRWPGE